MIDSIVKERLKDPEGELRGPSIRKEIDYYIRSLTPEECARRRIHPEMIIARYCQEEETIQDGIIVYNN
jgi:hypothetical protein